MKNRLQLKQKVREDLGHNDEPFGLSTVEFLNEITDLASSQTYPAEIELFQQGAPAREIYFIEEGVIKLVYLNPNGKEAIIGLRSSGWPLDASALILQEPHPVTAVTVTRCRLYHVSAETFRHLLNRNPQLSNYLLRTYSREVYDQMSRIAELECFSARQRLERLLWQMLPQTEQGGPQKEKRLRMPLKHSEIAQLIAITPEHLSRLFKLLEREGVISRKGGGLVISSSQSLSRS
jgi:CRP-like cAMP-binding protein